MFGASKIVRRIDEFNRFFKIGNEYYTNQSGFRDIMMCNDPEPHSETTRAQIFCASRYTVLRVKYSRLDEGSADIPQVAYKIENSGDAPNYPYTGTTDWQTAPLDNGYTLIPYVDANRGFEIKVYNGQWLYFAGAEGSKQSNDIVIRRVGPGKHNDGLFFSDITQIDKFTITYGGSNC